MKRNKYFLILVILGVNLFPCIKSQISTVKVEYSNSKFNDIEQWVYLVHRYENQVELYDSTYVKKYAKNFHFNIPIKKEEYIEIVFSKKGDKISFPIYPNENIVVVVDSLGLNSIEGSEVMKEKINDKKITNKLLEQLRELNEKRRNSNSKEELKMLDDSIRYLKNYLRIGLLLNFIKSSNTAFNSYYYYLVVKDLIPKATSDSIISELKVKFPKDERIQMFPSIRTYPESSENTKKVKAFLDKIARNKNPTMPNVVDNKRPADDIDLKTYVIEDKVSNITLVDYTGKDFSLNELKTDYILIDFWASWCGPCRSEIRNYMLKDFEKYKDVLSIYSITIDENDKDWKEAIEFDNSNVFTQVTVNNNPNKNKIIKQFDVKAIPKNFLLDKDRKIIAVNLRGDDLYLKIKELELNKNAERQ